MTRTEEILSTNKSDTYNEFLSRVDGPPFHSWRFPLVIRYITIPTSLLAHLAEQGFVVGTAGFAHVLHAAGTSVPHVRARFH